MDEEINLSVRVEIGRKTLRRMEKDTDFARKVALTAALHAEMGVLVHEESNEFEF